MSIEQIEEMMKIMNECCNVYDEQGNHIRNKCSECEYWSDDNYCCCSYSSKEAEALYNAGYRKQRVGVWIEDSLIDGVVICSLCGYTDHRFDYDREDFGSKFCPHCGARMEGGAE